MLVSFIHFYQNKNSTPSASHENALKQQAYLTSNLAEGDLPPHFSHFVRLYLNS